MNAISSGVASSAAKMRSPSFSRSSSSMTTTALPDLTSAIARSTESRRRELVMRRRSRSRTTGRGLWRPQRSGGRSLSGLHQSGDVLGEHVHLQVDSIAGFAPTQGGGAQGLGDEPDLEPVGAD